MQDLGVKIEYNKALGVDFTLHSLKKDGHDAIFLGIGMPQVSPVLPFSPFHTTSSSQPKTISIFEGLTEKEGFYTSKTFLPQVSSASKPGMCACKSQLPELWYVLSWMPSKAAVSC